MALDFDTSMIQAGIFVTPALSAPADVAGGSNSEIVFGSGVSVFLLTTGTVFDGDNLLAREVAPGTSGLFGACVQVTGADPCRRGPVIAELQIELGTTGGTGALTECVLVQAADGLRFIALTTAVLAVPG
jgi:hypothetical protein